MATESNFKIKNALEIGAIDGEAPIITNSSSKVLNLNADLLDDMESSSINSPSTIVSRDESGNFTSNAITAENLISNEMANLNGGLSQNNNIILNGTDTWIRTYDESGWKNETYDTGIFSDAIGVIKTLNLSSFEATYFKSTVSTGTAPVQVTSTTLNTNLNADLLDGQHGAYYAPLEALNSLINDDIVNTTNTFSSSKIQNLHNIQAEAISNLATANGKIENKTNPVFEEIPLVATIMPFNTVTNSSDENIFTFDSTNNTITFLNDAAYNFNSVIHLTSNTNSPVNISFRLINVEDDSIIITQTNDFDIPHGTTEFIPLNTLLTIGRNGMPSSPVTIRIEAIANASGYTLDWFTSILASGSSYDITAEAAGISVVPISNLTSTNVQDALEELQSELLNSATDLNGLSDVTITSPVNGQTLKYVDDHWENSNPASLGGLYNKYSITTLEGQVLLNAIYTPGFIEVFFNGLKLHSSEYTATDGSTVVLLQGAKANDIIDIISYNPVYQIEGSAIFESLIIHPIEGQIVIETPYTVSMVEVFINGIKLSSEDYIASDGSTIDLIESVTSTDVVEIKKYKVIDITSPSVLLDAIKTIDGPGSGLNADLLDGQEGSYYLDYENLIHTPDLSTKQDVLISGTNIKTLNGSTLLGEGDMVLEVSNKVISFNGLYVGTSI